MPIVLVPLEQIDDNPYQCRHEYGEISELAADILRHKTARPDTLGLQQIPAGRLVGDDGDLIPIASMESGGRSGWLIQSEWRIQLEFGHRRRRAFAHLVADGWHEYARMPVRLVDLTDEQMLDGVWSENHERRNLSAVEEAELLRLKLERGGGSQSAVATSWGLARSTVANRLGLLELPAAIQAANRAGILSERQCQALRPIARLLTLDLSHVEWGDMPTSQYLPMSPAAFLSHVIREESELTSDEIRRIGANIIRHAGSPLRGDLPVTILAGEGILQDTCTACPWRQNDHCLHVSCLPAKQTAFIRQAAEKLPLPWSDNARHFEPFQHHHDLLLAAHQQRACPHLVVGWDVSGHAARPFGNGHYYSEYSDMDVRAVWDAERPAGLCLGCTHGPQDGCFASVTVAPEPPPSDDQRRRQTFSAWRERGQRQNKRLHRATLDTLAYVYQGIFPDTARAILAQLVGLEKAQAVEDGELCRQLATSIWNGSHKIADDDPVTTYRNASALLRLAGQPETALMQPGSLAELAAEAERWLASYGSRLYYYDPGSRLEYYMSAAAAALPAFDRLLAELDSRRSEWGGNEDLGQLYEDLRQARVHAQTVCAQTAESGAEVVQG